MSGDALDPDDDTQVKDLTKEEREKYEECLEQEVTRSREDKVVKYRRLLNDLYAERKIYTIRVPAKEFLLPRYADLSETDRARLAVRRQASNPQTRGFLILQPNLNEDGDTEWLDTLNMDPAREEGGEMLSDEDAKAIGEAFNANVAGNPGDFIDIPYFYFGDLLNSALRRIRKNSDEEEFEMIVGSIELIDPLVAFQISNIDKIHSCGAGGMRNVNINLAKLTPLTHLESTGIKEHFNIAKIPISLNAFQEWFVQSVIKPGKDSYYLLHFIKDILASLLYKAMAVSCAFKFPVDIPRFASNQELLRKRETRRLRGKVISNSKIIGLKAPPTAT